MIEVVEAMQTLAKNRTIHSGNLAPVASPQRQSGRLPHRSSKMKLNLKIELLKEIVNLKLENWLS